MIVEKTKERILQYLDFKGISTSKFFQETGIKRGFLDADKLGRAVSDTFIANIIATYPELNLVWLITGKGEMLNKPDNELSKNDMSKIPLTTKEELLLYQLSKKDKEISSLNREIGMLQHQITISKSTGK